MRSHADHEQDAPERTAHKAATPSRPGPGAPTLMRLQRLAGNRAVAGLVSGAGQLADGIEAGEAAAVGGAQDFVDGPGGLIDKAGSAGAAAASGAQDFVDGPGGLIGSAGSVGAGEWAAAGGAAAVGGAQDFVDGPGGLIDKAGSAGAAAAGGAQDFVDGPGGLIDKAGSAGAGELAAGGLGAAVALGPEGIAAQEARMAAGPSGHGKGAEQGQGAAPHAAGAGAAHEAAHAGGAGGHQTPGGAGGAGGHPAASAHHAPASASGGHTAGHDSGSGGDEVTDDGGAGGAMEAAEAAALPGAVPGPEAVHAGPLDDMPRPEHETTAAVYDEVLTAHDAGQAELAQAVAQTLAAHRAHVTSEQSRLGQAEAAQLAAVSAAVTGARAQVAGAVAAARDAVAQAGDGARSELGAQHTAQQTKAGTLVTEGSAKVRQLGETHGDSAVSTASSVASSVRSQVDGQAAQARAQGAKIVGSLAGTSPQATAAMHKAAQEVAAQTAQQITESLGTTESDLRAVGPEVRKDMVGQGVQLGVQIGMQILPVTTQLAQTVTQADAALGKASTEGAASVDKVGQSVLAGLDALLRTARSGVSQRAAAGRGALLQSASATEAALVREGAQAAAKGRASTAEILGQVTSRRIRRTMARDLSSSMTGMLRDAYGMSSSQARSVSQQIADQFVQAAAHVHQSVTEAGHQGASHARAMGGEGAGQASAVQNQVASQLGSLLNQAVAQGEQAVEGTAQALSGALTNVDKGFAKAVTDLRAKLEGHAGEAVKKAGEPLSTLDSRMNEAANRARQRVDDGWLLSQLKDAWEALTPGFIAGLIVGLLVTIAIVAICGTGIGALILAGAVAGAASVLASNGTDYACGTGKYANGKEWSWAEVGKEAAMGAIFGAAGGALGAGVTGAIGARSGSTIMNSLAQKYLATEAAQLAAGKVSNVVLGIGLGVGQNIVNDIMTGGIDHAFDHWDQGILLNAAVSGVMVSDLVVGKIHAATEGVRGLAVDSGMAFNVSSAEAAASAGRLAPSAEPASTGGVAKTEPMPAVDLGGTAKTEPMPAVDPGGTGGTGGTAKTEPMPAVDPTGTAKTEPMPAVDPTGTAKTEPMPAVDPTGTAKTEPIPAVDPAGTTKTGTGPTKTEVIPAVDPAGTGSKTSAPVEVKGMRIDQMLDNAGNPMVNPDGSPNGYGIRQGFDVVKVDGPGGPVAEVTMKVHLEPQAGASGAKPTPAELARMQADAIAGVDQHYNNGLQLPSGEKLQVKVQFVDDPAQAHLSVDVHPGDGPTVQNKWFLNDNPTTLAHELGHQLGFLDEYVDPKTVNRGSSSAPGVTNDNSLMGDFWQRDAAGNAVIDPATGKPMVKPGVQVHERHLAQLGGDIEAARGTAGGGTGGTGTSSPAPEATSTTGGSFAVPEENVAGSGAHGATSGPESAPTTAGTETAPAPRGTTPLDPQAARDADILAVMAEEQRRGVPSKEIGAEGTSTEGLSEVAASKGTGRVSRKNGGWDGEPGNSSWLPDTLDAVSATKGKPIEYIDNKPDFTPFAEDQVSIGKMSNKKNNADDFTAAREALMDKYPGRWNDEAHVKQWETAQGKDNWGNSLDYRQTWHHEPDGKTMTLVPTVIHEAAQHAGGASAARAGTTPTVEAPFSTHPL